MTTIQQFAVYLSGNETEEDVQHERLSVNTSETNRRCKEDIHVKLNLTSILARPKVTQALKVIGTPCI